MLEALFATKKSMTQVWTSSSKRLAVTRLVVQPNLVINKLQDNQLQIGYGHKKLKNVPKPARTQISRAGFSLGVKQLRGVKAMKGQEAELPKVGSQLAINDVLQVGDLIKVQGTSKGRGFAGAIKRHGFHGGPRTHGQSDRERAVGSIGAGTTPGKVWKGKKMPGHYGVDTKTVKGLVVLHIDQDNQEVWVSGPVPGSVNSTVKIIKTGKTKKVELDIVSSGIKEQKDKKAGEQVNGKTEGQENKQQDNKEASK